MATNNSLGSWTAPSSLLSRPMKCQAAGQDSVDGVTTELKVLNLLI